MNLDLLFQKIILLKTRFWLTKSKREKKVGDPIKFLLVGYLGARNTGSDVRVSAIVKQLQDIFKDFPLEITVATMDFKLTEGYFPGARQIKLPYVFIPFLLKECPKYDGIIACEGSMFKSQFSTALSTFMVGALGISNALDKLSIGYGGEAGEMSPDLKEFVRTMCEKSLIICRNEQSRKILKELNVRNKLGTDTAWTFTPAPQEKGQLLLKRMGWDGQKEILAIAPINPFWWPVRPSFSKAFVHYLTNKHKKTHHKSIYFHEYSKEDENKFEQYIEAMTNASLKFCKKHNLFPILIGMERLDRKACVEVVKKADVNIPMFISDEYDMYDLVSVLRNASFLLSSRYHAIVTTMPTLIPSAGISMDERICNLMEDRGTSELVLKTDEQDLESKITQVLDLLYQNKVQIKQQIALHVEKQIKILDQMGKDLKEEFFRIYPELVQPDLESTSRRSTN